MALKSKKRKKGSNVFVYHRGFPDQSDEFDHLLNNVDGGVILCKRWHLAPALDDTDPAFACEYDEALYGEHLTNELKLSHLDASTQASVLALFKKYWSVFNEDGVNVSIRD